MQSKVEIVGFLPHIMGDLFVATRDYLAQMGSDFDVDSIYTYMYNSIYNEETKKLSKITSTSKYKDLYSEERLENREKVNFYYKKFIKSQEEDIELVEKLTGETVELDKKEAYELALKQVGVTKDDISVLNKNEFKLKYLQNQLIDILFSIHSNPDLTVQTSILQPADFWEFKNMADEIKDIRLKGKDNKYWSGLYDGYQKKMYIDGGVCKSGCLGYGTKVLMYNGKFKEVQDIIEGDLLMGIDSTPRKVLQNVS